MKVFSPGTAVKLLPCDHEVMCSSPGNSLLQICREMIHAPGCPFIIRRCLTDLMLRDQGLKETPGGNFASLGFNFFSQ
jgi:hypothetical protein